MSFCFVSSRYTASRTGRNGAELVGRCRFRDPLPRATTANGQVYWLLALLCVLHAPRGFGANTTEIYKCTREARISGECRWCHRDWPSKGGVWSDMAPYWQQPGCSNQAFSHAEVKTCLAGRTIYAIGNSIARQTAFNIVEMMGGNPVKREDQRDECPKSESTWDDSCHQDFANVKIKYLYLQFADGFRYEDRNGFPYFRYKVDGQWVTGRMSHNETGSQETGKSGNCNLPTCNNAANFYEDDNCIHQETRSCLAHFFRDSKETDVLVFTLGMTYAFTNFDQEPSNQIGLDWTRWLTSSMTGFKEHLSATYKGQIFRPVMAEPHPTRSYHLLTPWISKVNSLMWDIMRPTSTDLPWYTIDQWAINKNRYHLYDDHLHFNGKLTFAMLTQVLNELCPLGGHETWSYPADGNHLSVYKTLPPCILVKRLSGRDRYYMVLLGGVRHDIPNMDTLHGLGVSDKDYLEIDEEVFEFIPAGEVVQACDPDVPPGCMDNYHYKALHA